MSEEGIALLPEVGREGFLHSRESQRAEEARGYARLLVSDIRLYHEEDVILGRAAADLSRRLAVAIDSARAAYRRRFEDEAPFDRELVRILAGGDPRRLGS